jgi:cobalamin biosynthesis protein CobT
MFVFDIQEVQVTLSMTNPVESIVKVTLHPCEEGNQDNEDDENKKNEDCKENVENEKNEENKTEDNEKIEEKSDKDKKDETTGEKKSSDEEKGASETAEQEKDEKKKKKTDSLVASALFDRKTERRVNNRCESRAFVPTAEVSLSTIGHCITFLHPLDF